MLAALTAAEDGAMVRCALAKTPRAEQAAVQRAMVEGVTGGTALTARTEALLVKLRTRAAECNPGSGRSDSRIGEIAVATVAVESLSSALQSRGVDVQAINARLGRTPPAVLDAMLARKRTAAIDALGRDMLALAGDKADDAAVLRLIPAYAFNAARLAKLFISSAS